MIVTDRQGYDFAVRRGEDVVTRHRRGRIERVGEPGAFIELNPGQYLADWALPYELTPTEARALAAALVRLADEIDGEQEDR